MSKTTLPATPSPKKQFRYRAIERMNAQGQTIRQYPSEQAAIERDAGKMLALQRDLYRNSDAYNAIICFLLNNILGSEASEILWRDEQHKDELEKLWRRFVRTADATGRDGFVTLETYVVTEFLVAGEILIHLQDDMKIGLIEAERLRSIDMDSKGRIKAYIVNNGDKDVRLSPDKCLYVAYRKRASQSRGSPLLSSVADNLFVLTSIVRSLNTSWSKVAKHALTCNIPGGADGIATLNGQNPDSDEIEEKEINPPAVMDVPEGTIFISDGGTLSPIPQNQIPGQGFGESVKSMMRLIASSAGLSGDLILGDISGFSYSACRASHAQVSAVIKRLQAILRYSFYIPLIEWLLDKWGIPPETSFDVILPNVVILDDLNDVKARRERLELGLSSYEDELLGLNRSRKEHIQQLETEMIDAINAAKNVKAATGVDVSYNHFVGLSRAKTAEAVTAGNNVE